MQTDQSVENLKKGRGGGGHTKLYYNGIPKTLLKKTDGSMVDKDKLSYAKSIWL